MIGCLFTAIFGVATALAPSFKTFIALLFLANAAQTAIFPGDTRTDVKVSNHNYLIFSFIHIQTCFILAVENVGKSYRGLLRRRHRVLLRGRRVRAGAVGVAHPPLAPHAAVGDGSLRRLPAVLAVPARVHPLADLAQEARGRAEDGRQDGRAEQEAQGCWECLKCHVFGCNATTVDIRLLQVRLLQDF